MMLWGIRAGGLIVLVVGFGMILQPLRVLADVLPPVGAIVGVGVGLVALLLGLLVGGIVIAVAWFAVRPILSVIILATVEAVVFLLFRIGRLKLKRKAAAEASPAT